MGTLQLLGAFVGMTARTVTQQVREAVVAPPAGPSDVPLEQLPLIRELPRTVSSRP